MKIGRRETLGVLLAGLGGLAARRASGAVRGPAATIYSNGDILTMVGDAPSLAEALVESDGRIAFVGPFKDAQARFPGARSFDLAGRTLLPGFIDGHGHLYLTGFTSLMANILPPPDGPASSFESIVQTTRSWMASPAGERFIRSFGWVVANGYDDALLEENAHPTAELLDRISTELPVVAIHQSGHVGCLNTRGLAAMGYTRDSVDPPGGALRRRADGSLTGVVDESAYKAVGFAILKRSTPAIDALSIDAAQDVYAGGGYTTAQEARALANMTTALGSAAASGKLRIDVVSYPDIQYNAGALEAGVQRRYSGRHRVGGAKLSLDGSPQAKTAWLTQPYHLPPRGFPTDYRGYAAMSDAEADAHVAKALRSGWPLHVHANGDAAIDQFLDAVERALAGTAARDHRTVLIHGQTLRIDQVERLARSRILPSLFAAHTFYWGDHHRRSVLGPVRAQRISPTRDVLDAGLTLTSHHDSPVIPPNAMRVLDATVNRVTRSGVVLGPEQRLTVYEGLSSLTKWAAHQCFEEGEKGTLEAGKVADMTVLSANPLKVDPGHLHRIQVVKTIKEGKPVGPSST